MSYKVKLQEELERQWDNLRNFGEPDDDEDDEQYQFFLMSSS